jgi:hypothetical protein
VRKEILLGAGEFHQVKIFIPANAGTHLASILPVDKWIPASAGMTT